MSILEGLAGMAGGTQSTELDEDRTFEEFYAAHRDPVFRFCYARVGQGDIAEDLLGDTFMRAYPHRRKLLAFTEEEARKWLLKTAKNLAVDRYRHQKRLLRLLPRLGRDSRRAEPDPQREVAVRSQLEAAIAGIAELPIRDRTLLALRVTQGLSIAEIAALTGRSVDAVDMALRRARARLRERCPAIWEDAP